MSRVLWASVIFLCCPVARGGGGGALRRLSPGPSLRRNAGSHRGCCSGSPALREPRRAAGAAVGGLWVAGLHPLGTLLSVKLGTAPRRGGKICGK